MSTFADVHLNVRNDIYQYNKNPNSNKIYLSNVLSPNFISNIKQI